MSSRLADATSVGAALDTDPTRARRRRLLGWGPQEAGDLPTPRAEGAAGRGQIAAELAEVVRLEYLGAARLAYNRAVAGKIGTVVAL